MNKLQLFLSATIILAFVGCKAKKQAKTMPPLRVEVVTTSVDSLYSRINIASQIDGLNKAVIQPRVDGFLLATHFTGGMPVDCGDLLFTIDPSTFATTLYSARAELESARASEALALSNYQRAEPLVAIAAISQSDLDQYRATYKAARASTKSAKETLRSAVLEIGYTKIYAPISGIATKTTAAVGDYIGLGTAQSELTTITQTDTVSVQLPIPTSKYMQFTAGNTAGTYDNSTLLSDIELKLTDSTTYNYKGEYYYTLESTPTASSDIVIVVKFPNPQLQLKEGMFARVSANIGAKQDCITLPKSAVSQLQGVNSVWVIKPDSTAQWRKVALGKSYDDKWEIISGIDTNEQVVIDGGIKLHNGSKVAIAGSK